MQQRWRRRWQRYHGGWLGFFAALFSPGMTVISGLRTCFRISASSRLCFLARTALGLLYQAGNRRRYSCCIERCAIAAHLFLCNSGACVGRGGWQTWWWLCWRLFTHRCLCCMLTAASSRKRPSASALHAKFTSGSTACGALYFLAGETPCRWLPSALSTAPSSSPAWR